MIKTEFQKNIINNNNLKAEIEELKLNLCKKEKILEEKITSLKEDLKFSLMNNDLINLELRNMKLTNFIYKIIGGTSILLNLYLLNKKIMSN